MKRIVKILAGSLIAVIVVGLLVAQGAGEVLTITLDAGDYEITTDDTGLQRITMENFGSLVQMGEPWLPGRIFNIALPPLAEVHSVTVEGIASRELPGAYNLVPTPPMLPQMELDRNMLRNIREEWEIRRRRIYDSDDPFPEDIGQLVGTGGMRKYTFARVSFIPFVYYPQSQRLIHYSSARVTIDYTAPGMTPEVQRLLSDRKMEDRAARLLLNYRQAQRWYPRAFPEDKQEDHDYVIITSPGRTAACDTLIDWKRDLGYDVKVVTTAWIDTAYAGADVQEKIREFLKDKYLEAEWGIEYVLIAADDDSIPMRRCFPHPANHRAASDTTTPTDFYYAELTSNWDSDGDGFPGEHDEDVIDWAAEVYVGRIATNNAATIHDICKKLVEFEAEDASSWKYDGLLLGAMSNFADEDTNWDWDKTDGAELMVDMIADMLPGALWDYTTMYEKDGEDTSTYLCDQDLTHNNAVNAWSSGTYGIVNWWGHGNSSGAYRYVWVADDGDGVPESWEDELEFKDMIRNSDAPSLDDDHPSIIFANSCLCGEIEQNHLAQKLLENGSSGMVASTRVSWYRIGWVDEGNGGNASLDYYFFDELLNHDKKLGEALFDAKSTYASNHLWRGWKHQMNMFDFCLWGDPSLIWQGAIPAADTISNDTTWTVSQSPYLVENRLFIRGTDGPDNVTTLTINPGVRVVFGEDGALVVGSASATRPGALVADGKPDSLIVFTSASDTTKNEVNDWMGLEFLDYSSDAKCKLDHCLIEYPSDGIYCLSASPSISNCLVRNVYRHGICCYSDSDPAITHTVVHDCGQMGIRLSTNCDPTMYGDSVAACRYGLFIEYGSPSVDSCFFMNNVEDGVLISGNTAGPTISNCYARDNGSAGINAYNWSIPIISGCQVSYNSIWGIILSGVDGGQVYGNTVTHHDSIAGIELQSTQDTVRVYSNTLTDNECGLFLNASTSSSPSVIYYNTIEDNDYGVSIEDTASISIHHNDILDNTVLNLNYGPIDTLVAEYNWWGSTNTAAIEAKLGGYGEIDYIPFLTNTYHAPWVEVTYPNGGEAVSDTAVITWVAPDVDGDSVSIFSIGYSDDGGITWHYFATGEPNDGAYPWDTTLRKDSTAYLIEINAYDGTYASWDVSDSLFTVYNPDPPAVMVLDPNGGETLFENETDILWWANDPDLGDSTILTVDLEYSSDAGTTWADIDSNQANDGVYDWDLSELEDGTEYLIRLTVNDTSGLSAEDSCDALFEINKPDIPSVSVLSPNGGEHWSGMHDIVWTATDPDSQAGLTFDLFAGLATAADTAWTQLLDNSSDTSYSWNTTIFSDWGTYYAKVVVTDPDTLTDEDLSNTSFTVDNTPPPMPAYLHLDAYWDAALGLGTVDLSWEDVTDTLSPPEYYQVFYGTSDGTIDYNTPIYSGSNNTCTIDSLSTGPHYFGLKARDNADQPNWVTYQKSKGTNGEAVYFTTGADVNLSSVAGNSNGVVTGSSPNFSLDGTVVLTYPNFMIINYESLTAGDSDGHHALRVYGRLSTHKSIFTAASAGDWRGIVFADSSMDYDTTTTVGCLVDSCTIRHAVNGISCSWCSPMINGSEISLCSNAGINCFWSGAFIRNNDANVGGVHHNAYGIYEDGEGPSGLGIIVEYNEIRDNTSAGVHHGALARPSISHNLIHDNAIGAEFETWAMPVTFDRNDIYSNTSYGVVNDTTSMLVTAENNWWGAADGPSGQGSGSGDAVGKNVDFQPFLTFPTGTDVVDWCQLISPSSITMDVGDTTGTILGQVYEPGVTPGVGQGAGITAQVGYGSNNSESSGTGWKWSTASYVRDVGNNDEYGGTLTVSRSGTYDYAFRFSKDGGTNWVYADLNGNDQGGEGTNGYTTDQAGDLTVGHVLNPVIVIDDDIGSWQNNYHDALSNNGINFDTWDVFTQGSPPAGILNKYQVVVWETGEDLTNTLTLDDEINLMAYLDNGGHLFLSSQGYLTETGAPSPFITDYLHVDIWWDDVAGIERERGEPGDVIADGLDLQLDWPLCEGTDDMIPGFDAVGIFQNDHSKSGKQFNFGGLRYPVGAVKSDYRLVLLSFPFESILDEAAPNNQTAVMGRVMDWLVGDLSWPEALMAGDKYPGYVPLTWSPPDAEADTLQIHDGTLEGRIRGNSGNVVAVSLTPDQYPCILRTLMFHVWDIQPMTAVDMYVFADTSAPGPAIAGPYEVITLGHGDGWVFVDIWEDQVTIDNGDVYIGVAFRYSTDTGIGVDRTSPFHDMGWWGLTPSGPWTLLSDFGYPFDISDPSISAVVVYEEGGSKILGVPRGIDLLQFGTAAAGSKSFLGYNVYRSEMQGGPYGFLDFVPKDHTTYEDSTVTGGEQYWYVVSATYHQEETGYSNEDHGTSRSMLPPEAVDDLQITLEIGDLHLSWSPVSLDTAGYPKAVDRYNIYRVTDPAMAIGEEDSVGTSYVADYVDQSAAGDTAVQYFYVIKAIDAEGTKSVESNMVGEFDRIMENSAK